MIVAYIGKGTGRTRHDCRSQCLVCCEQLRRKTLFLFLQLSIVLFIRLQVNKTYKHISLVLLGRSTFFYKTYKHLIFFLSFWTLNICFLIIVNNNFRGSHENNPRTWASIDAWLHVIAPPPSGNACLLRSLSLPLSNCVVETHISEHVCFFIVVIEIKLLASFFLA